MYAQYYGFDEFPFELTPDTDFFYQSPSHQQALQTLSMGIQQGDGFLKLTGEVGTGKTLLCRKLMGLFDGSIQFAYVPNPCVNRDELLTTVARDLGLPISSEKNLLSLINDALIENARKGKRTVLLLDEAQALPVESLETLRLLSNLETRKQKLLQIILFGQPELDKLLARRDLRQLKQRIVHSCHLTTLSPQQIKDYIRHRVLQSGYFGPQLFSESAIRSISEFSRGIPRLVNLLCHKSLLLSWGSGSFYVSPGQVKQAAAESEQILFRWFLPLWLRGPGLHRRTASPFTGANG